MTPRTEIMLWSLSAVLLLSAVAVARRPVSRAAPSNARRLAVGLRAPDTALVQRNVATIVARDPFRLDRSPSPLPFVPGGAQVVTQMAAPLPPTPRPALQLRAIVGGPPWEALLEGIPGRPGAVRVRAGERVGELSVRLIRRDSVIVQGMDTTWRLGIARSWQ